MSGWLAAMKKDAPEAKPEDAPAIGGADVTKVVVDTNAIVKGFRLERFADEAVTIPEVLQEVRDKQARHTLATLPFELKVRDPDEASLKAVRRFARLTGDLGALSEPDLRVIALAYMLERDAHGVAHLREDPPARAVQAQAQQGEQDARLGLCPQRRRLGRARRTQPGG